MISGEIQSKISEILMTLAEEERNVEVTRQVLTENKDYNPYQIFCFLDNEKKNKINSSDLFNFLRNKNIFSTENEIKLLILFYDYDLDTNLNLEEFINLIESKTSNKKELKENNEPITFPIEYSLTKLLEKEIVYARKLLTLLEDLKGFPDFNIHNIFHFLKDDNNKFITPENIIKFFNGNYVSFTDNDIDLIFKRIDKAKDNKIDLCEFHLFFGFPECEYNCPFLKCDNCNLVFCNSCKNEDQCLIHKNSNFRNEDNKNLNERTYKTYYTEFQKKTNKKEDEDDNKFNNGYQKISDNLTLRLSPKREYAPFEIYIEQNDDLNEVKKNFAENFKNYDNFNNENINTINQNFSEKININKGPSFKQDSIINNQNLINSKENEENNDTKNELNIKINNETNQIIKNKSYLNKNEYEEKQFIDYLRKAMKHESIIENMKIELSLRCDFNWEKVFRLFELEGRGFLTKEDLKIGLNQFNIFPRDLDISLLLKRYDLKNEGFLSYPDFFELIAPFSKYHKMMVENRSINPDVKDINPDEFNSETQRCIKNLFSEILNGEFELNKEKENFSSLKNNFSNIFKLIDTNDCGYISEKDFVIYIQKNNLFKSGNECDLLFLRFNKLRNGRIEYQEMLNEIEPIH